MRIQNYNISLSIVKKIKPLSYKIILIYWVIGMLSIIIALIVGSENVPEKLRLFILIVFASSNIIWWFGNVIIKKHIKIGHFVLTNDSLKIIQNDDSKSYALSNIEYLRFEISGCEGDSYGIQFGSARVNEGIDNKISFINEKNLYNYNFLIEKRSQLNYLKLKIKYLRKNNYKILTSL
jgi:hypothetical protein